MTSVAPPTYYFNGIYYNSSFYTVASTSGLTTATANALYLQKTIPDTTTVLETFSGGILTNSLDTSETSSNFDLLSSIGASNTIGIGCIAPTYDGVQTIQIGSQSTTSVLVGGISFNSATLNSSVNSTGGILSLGDQQITGVLNIGGGRREITGNGGSINIGNGIGSIGPIKIGSGLSSAVPIVMGTSNGTIALNAPTTAYSLTTSTIYSGNIDSSAGPSASSFNIGNGVGTGTMTIGYTASSGRQINIGNANLQTSVINIGAVGGTVALAAPTTCSGLLTASAGIKTDTIDTSTAGPLTIGGNNCSGITFLDTAGATTFTGAITTAGLSLSGTNNITLASGVLASAAQLGYVYLLTPIAGTTFTTTTITKNGLTLALPSAGVWSVLASFEWVAGLSNTNISLSTASLTYNFFSIGTLYQNFYLQLQQTINSTTTPTLYVITNGFNPMVTIRAYIKCTRIG